jgi:hypothetical protein
VARDCRGGGVLPPDAAWPARRLRHVTLSRVSAHATRITVVLRVHDTRARPVHIHGGRCGSFFGLPFGAWTMHGARGSTVVRASLAELVAGIYAIDVHAGVSSPAWVTCANLGA